MIVQIPEITINPFLVEDEAGESAYEAESDAVDSAWISVYNAIDSGAASVAYWDMHGTPDSFTRYALHRSTRRAGCLQRSVMWMRDGEVVPLSHSEHDGAKGFLREVAGSGAVTVFVREF